jgi:hypothetical protein
MILIARHARVSSAFSRHQKIFVILVGWGDEPIAPSGLT